MLRHIRLQNWKFQSDISSVPKVFSSILINFRECHKSPIYQDEDSFDEKPFRNSRNRRERFSYLDDVRAKNNFKLSQRNFPDRKYSFDNYRSSNFGEKLLDSVDRSESWQQNIEKYFYAEHPDVSNCKEHETQLYRESLNITVRGSGVPNPIKSFSQLSLPERLKDAVLEQGYAEPTPIQAQGWPTILSGRDMVGISQTGSGKTLVFVLPAIIHAMNQPDQCLPRECKPQILILGPTRELVQQILQVTEKFSRSCNLMSACAYGGASKLRQLQQLRGASICVATPGRLIDFVSEGSVSLQKCTYLVLDEADRMLDMGFEPQIRKIVHQIRKDRQTVMFSATWPKEIKKLAEDFLTDYVQVTVGAGELVANPNIKQNIYFVESYDKEDKFVSLLEELSGGGETKILVFAQTKRTVDYLSHRLRKLEIPAVHIHGDVSQFRRDEVLYTFRKRKSCVLIATDVAARGLDIVDVQHIINYDLPTNIEDYIHRIGRTARGTNSGSAHSLLTPEDDGLARDLVAVMRQAGQEVDERLVEVAGRRKGGHKGYSPYRPREAFQRSRRYSY